jgi:hypothetical protein
MSMLKMPIINRKANKYLCIAYAIVLLCLLAGYYMIPREGFLDVPDNGEDIVRKAQTEKRDIFENILAVGRGEYKGLRIIEKWDLKHDGKQLVVSIPDENISDYIVYVEHKDTSDGIIEIQQLATSSVVSYVDVTEKLSRPVTAKLTGNILSITPPHTQEIEVKRFDKEFPLKQFMKSGTIFEDNSYNRIKGNNVIYIRAPEQVAIIGKRVIHKNDLINNMYKKTD